MKHTEFHVKKNLDKVIASAKLTHPSLYSMAISDRYRSGVPDRILMYDGLILFVEVKKPGGKLSKIQDYTIKKLYQAGIISVVWSEDKNHNVVISAGWDLTQHRAGLLRILLEHLKEGKTWSMNNFTHQL